MVRPRFDFPISFILRLFMEHPHKAWSIANIIPQLFKKLSSLLIVTIPDDVLQEFQSGSYLLDLGDGLGIEENF